jgi:hypothetical protein
MLLFIIQIEPLPALLQRDLAGLNLGLVREASLGRVDDMAALGTNEADLDRLDTAVADFETVSVDILNRNRKTFVVSLGTWASHWPVWASVRWAGSR